MIRFIVCMLLMSCSGQLKYKVGDCLFETIGRAVRIIKAIDGDHYIYGVYYGGEAWEEREAIKAMDNDKNLIGCDAEQ